jgi:hypothetical protein
LTREPKPDWREVPAALRDKIAATIGEPVVSGEKVFGGFGPMATFVLTTASGARHFCKGSHPGNTQHGHAATLREFENLAAFPELARFGAALRGTVDGDGWHLAVLDFAERGTTVPPWSDTTIAQAIGLIASFHAAMPARAADTLRDRAAFDLLTQGGSWHSLSEPAMREKFVALFQDSGAAGKWLEAHLGQFVELQTQGASLGGPQGWMHMDIRSDNLVFTRGGGLLLVDWPALSFGPQLLDIAFFLPSLAGEGGPRCADGLRLYEDAAGVTFASGDVAVAATLVAGFFAARAGEPEEAALPRLRWVQKMQLFPALGWLSDCLGLAPPPLPKPFEP